MTDGLEHEVIGDAAVRALLQRYVALAGAELREVGAHRHELRVPMADRPAFGGREAVRIAFSVEALEEDPDAEMAIVGSAFVEQLIGAVRRYGARRRVGRVPPSVATGSEDARLPAPVENGTAGVPATRETVHPVGRLTARVSVRAGASVEEHLVDGGLFDLATGHALPADVAAACDGAGAPAGATVAADEQHGEALARSVAELIPLMLGDLEARLAPRVEGLRQSAERSLAAELARIDRYYTTLLEDAAGRGGEVPSAEARGVIEAEHRRRREEEVRRHEVRATVHPLQLTEWGVPVQRAEWPLTSTDGHRATLVAQRALVGSGAWVVACPTCGTPAPAHFAVCAHDHAACAACARACAVCDTRFCRSHGLAACHVDGRPACDAHSRRCASCRREHCTTHQGTCADGGHLACSACLAACPHCGRVVCERHATRTHPEAPLGVRRLCAECVRYCEGGTGEVVGPDEVARCASCERVVCARHRTVCAVDGLVHCSAHVRRTDRSRRLVCERDRAACAYEPNAIFATDEVAPCTSCGAMACAQHAAACATDGRRFCTTHLAPLRDQPGAFGCAQHHTVCHVDGVTFSLTGTADCPICARRSCAQHRHPCGNCGRAVCSADLSGGRTCRTCRGLAPLDDPDDLLVEAVVRVQGEGAPRARGWRGHRDATHRVVEVDLGWTRRLVVAVRHGSATVDSAVAHSLLGTRTVVRGS